MRSIASFSVSRSLGFLIAALLLMPATSQAVSDPHGWVGGLFGLSVPNYKDTTARPIWGLTAGAKLGSEWGLGAYYLTSTKDETSNNVTGKFGYDMYGVELAYHFEGEARGAYIGGRLGMSRVNRKVQSLEVATNPMHYGVVTGYNYFLGDHFSLGGELNYMAVSGENATLNGAAANQDSFSTLNFLASAKLWF